MISLVWEIFLKNKRPEFSNMENTLVVARGGDVNGKDKGYKLRLIKEDMGR